MKNALCIVLVLLSSWAAAGCANKAKAIQVSAANFSAESQRTITLMDELMTRETTETLTDQDKKSELFMEKILGATGVISPEQLKNWAHPYSHAMPETKAQKAAYFSTLLSRYTEFANMFTSLDKGSLFAGDAVVAAIPVTKELTANMAALGLHWSTHPANFIPDKTTLAKDASLIIADGSQSPDARKLRIKDVERKWRSIEELEQQMTQALVEQALKSAKLGQSLTALLERYDELDLNDLNELMAKAFELAGLVPGLELDKYEATANSIIKELEKDELAKNFVNQALTTLSAVE